MRASVVAASASTVTVTVERIPADTTDFDVIVAAARAAASYGVAENGHRISRATPTASNPVEAVVTLDREVAAA